jgi:VanZ family protein
MERHSWRWALSSIIVVAVFAASDEFHQTFVATRTPSIVDVGIDTLGGLLAQCVSVTWIHYRQKHPRVSRQRVSVP